MSMFETIAAAPWVVALGLVLGGFGIGRLLALVLRPLLSRIARRSAWRWDDVLVDATATPLCMLVAVRALHAALPWLSMETRGRALVDTTTAVLTTGLVVWAGFRAVDVAVTTLARRPWAFDRPATRSLLAIAGRASKAVLVVLSAIVVLAHLGVSVASLIAGLGIGGLALALASQKTVENPASLR